MKSENLELQANNKPDDGANQTGETKKPGRRSESTRRQHKAQHQASSEKQSEEVVTVVQQEQVPPAIQEERPELVPYVDDMLHQETYSYDNQQETYSYDNQQDQGYSNN